MPHQDQAAELARTEDSKINFKRSAMVLFSLEQALGSYVREKVNELSDLPNDQTKKFIEGPKKINTVEGLIQETYVAEILDLAISAANLASDQNHLRTLKKLADCLELYDIRNAIAHPNRDFPACYWYRLAAIANDPVIEILGFNTVKNAFHAALSNKISLPPDEWFKVFAFTLPNNLPSSFEHEITGLIGREREKTDLLKKFKSKRFGLIALVGPGGTGKTAIALDLLHDSVLDPKTYEWADEIVFVTAKTERLTKDGPVSIDNPIASIDDLKASIVRELAISNELEHVKSIEEVATVLGDRKVFLCIDNLETLLRDHPEPFDDFYTALPEDWRMLVTSRVPVDSATNVPINPMRPEAATALARSYLQKRGGGPLDTSVFDQLVEKTERNPLAIRISVDGVVSGLDVASALAQSRDSILEFSYTNLLKSLPSIANQVLECLFAANRQLTRVQIQSLLDREVDEIAIGIQALLRTSLVTRHSDENVESYSLSSSIRDLLLRHPLDDDTRTAVFSRLAQQQIAISQIQSQERNDPLDSDYIPGNYPTEIAHETYRAFQMIRRREPKATMADQVDQLRSDLRTHNEPALYRAAAALLLELNDRESARQMLEMAQSRNALDSSARLMLAEMYRNENRLEECYATSDPLRSGNWFADEQIDRSNLGRLARVTWLVGIWLGRAFEEIQHVSDWNQYPRLRAIKGAMYSTALRKLLEAERRTDKVNSYIQESAACLDEVFRFDGYIGFVVAEAVKLITEIARKLRSNTALQIEVAQTLIRFVDDHLISICNVHQTISINDAEVQTFVETVKSHAKQVGIETAKNWGTPPVNDPVLEQYGYKLVTVYAPPVDSFGFVRGFLFAQGDDGAQYHVSKRVMQRTGAFHPVEERGFASSPST